MGWKEIDKYCKDIDAVGKKLHNKVRKSALDNKKLKDITNLLTCRFTDDEFLDKLDANPNLLGFDNGVVDVPVKCTDAGWKKVRNTVKGEYVNMSCGYEFYVNKRVEQLN